MNGSILLETPFAVAFSDASLFSPRRKPVLARVGWAGSLADLPREMALETDAAWDECLETVTPWAAGATVPYARLSDCPLPSTFLGAVSVSVWTCTAGDPVSASVDREFSAERPFRGAVIDACAGELADNIADFVDGELSGCAPGKGLKGTFRVSPGYGKLGLEWNAVLLDLIRGMLGAAGRFPVAADPETGILFPRKSVVCLKAWHQA